MHRAISRVIGRTCRKWQECPIVSGEEVRKGGHKKEEEKFIPDQKYSLGDAVGWTAGLVVAYELTHGKKRSLAIQERPQTAGFGQLSSILENSKCPFGWPRTVISQPILSQSVLDIDYTYPINIHPKGSIDVTPFIREDEFTGSGLDGGLYRHGEADDETVQFDSRDRDASTRRRHLSENTIVATKRSVPNLPSIPLTTKQVDSDSSDEDFSSKVGLLSDRLTGDFLSMLGAFKFLSNEAKGIKTSEAASYIDPVQDNMMSSDDPPLNAMDLMELGAELGSARALYNIGVAYDRMKDYKLAREYYCKASDLGHPLATYNCAVFLLKDGKIRDGLSMMRLAAENGVPEARNIVSKQA